MSNALDIPAEFAKKTTRIVETLVLHLKGGLLCDMIIKLQEL